MKRTDMEKMVKDLVGEPRLDDYASTYLDIAQEAVVNHLFPYRKDATWLDVPDKHHSATCMIAAYLVNKRGAEGETQHIESGVSRTYETAAIPRGFFAGMSPFVGVPKPCETSTEIDE